MMTSVKTAKLLIYAAADTCFLVMLVYAVETDVKERITKALKGQE